MNQYAALKDILDAFERGIKDGTIMRADDTAIMRSLVEQIIVRETEIGIEFKCVVTIRQEYVRLHETLGSGRKPMPRVFSLYR